MDSLSVSSFARRRKDILKRTVPSNNLHLVFYALCFSIVFMPMQRLQAATAYEDFTLFMSATVVDGSAGFDDVPVGTMAPFSTEGVLVQGITPPWGGGFVSNPEVLDELIDLAQSWWFGEGGSPPNFLLVNVGGFSLTFLSDITSVGIEYEPFAEGDSSFHWSLFSESGEKLESGTSVVQGFNSKSSEQFWGIVSDIPFRTIHISRVNADGSPGSANWVADEIRYTLATEQFVEEKLVYLGEYCWQARNNMQLVTISKAQLGVSKLGEHYPLYGNISGIEGTFVVQGNAEKTNSGWQATLHGSKLNGMFHEFTSYHLNLDDSLHGSYKSLVFKVMEQQQPQTLTKEGTFVPFECTD